MLTHSQGDCCPDFHSVCASTVHLWLPTAVGVQATLPPAHPAVPVPTPGTEAVAAAAPVNEGNTSSPQDSVVLAPAATSDTSTATPPATATPPSATTNSTTDAGNASALALPGLEPMAPVTASPLPTAPSAPIANPYLNPYYVLYLNQLAALSGQQLPPAYMMQLMNPTASMMAAGPSTTVGTNQPNPTMAEGFDAARPVEQVEVFAESPDSCYNKCFENAGNCFCDQNCVVNGDCCNDVFRLCPVKENPLELLEPTPSPSKTKPSTLQPGDEPTTTATEADPKGTSRESEMEQNEQSREQEAGGGDAEEEGGGEQDVFTQTNPVCQKCLSKGGYWFNNKCTPHCDETNWTFGTHTAHESMGSPHTRFRVDTE